MLQQLPLIFSYIHSKSRNISPMSITWPGEQTISLEYIFYSPHERKVCTEFTCASKYAQTQNNNHIQRKHRLRTQSLVILRGWRDVNLIPSYSSLQSSGSAWVAKRVADGRLREWIQTKVVMKTDQDDDDLINQDIYSCWWWWMHNNNGWIMIMKSGLGRTEHEKHEKLTRKSSFSWWTKCWSESGFVIYLSCFNLWPEKPFFIFPVSWDLINSPPTYENLDH